MSERMSQRMSEESRPPHDRYSSNLLLIVALGAALRVAVHFDLEALDPFFTEPALDSILFLDWAARIAGGDLLGDRVFFMGPLYPYFLAPIVALAGDAALIVIQLIQGVLGLLTILLVAGTTRKLAGPRVALLAALVVAAYPFFLSVEQKVLIATLAVFLSALALWLIVGLPGRRAFGRTLLTGIVLGFALLARPNIGLFILLLPFWFLVVAPAHRRLRHAAFRSLTVILGVLIVTLPVTYRNWRVGGDLVFVSSNAGVNLYMCNGPAAQVTGQMRADDVRSNPNTMEWDATQIAEHHERRRLKPSEVSSYWTRRTLDVVRDDPRSAASHLLRKVFIFLGGYEVSCNYFFEIERQESSILLSGDTLFDGSPLGLSDGLDRSVPCAPLCLERNALRRAPLPSPGGGGG